MILRIDDFSPNTGLDSFKLMLNEMKVCKRIDKIIVGVNLLSKRNSEGSVYPHPPFKSKEMGFFYQVDSVLNTMLLDTLGNVDIASHGLIHSDHSVMCRESQELSILTSCNLLNSQIFIPPFNKYDGNTLSVCRDNNIRLVLPEEGWRSLDYEVLVKNEFDRDHELWYMHPWRWTSSKFKEKVIRKLH